MKRTRKKKPTDCYELFLSETHWPLCWYCGRHGLQRPSYWNAPYIVERAHITSQPRIEDRRAVILLCSVCHFASHNTELVGYELPVIQLGHMLWLKRVFDPEYYDREFLQSCSIKRLPPCLVVPKLVMEVYASRNGSYPRKD